MFVLEAEAGAVVLPDVWIQAGIASQRGERHGQRPKFWRFETGSCDICTDCSCPGGQVSESTLKQMFDEI